jgi:uncharacterized membrane protein
LHSTPIAVVGKHPVHATLVSFPIVCFTLTLLTDIAYWQTANLMWQHFSEWLLLAGLVFGVCAAVAGAADLLLRPAVRALGSTWPHAIGGVIVLALAFFNSLVHAADGWTGVVPYGLVLSAVTVLFMAVTDWFGRAMVSRRGFGVAHHG